jgi:pimeloyl-ACP methyl ester carboxylesterase
VAAILNLALLAVLAAFVAVLLALLSPLIVLFLLCAWAVRGVRWLIGQRQPHYASTEISAADLQSTAPLLIAVHGTFAPNADWTKPEAPLCRTLDAALHGNSAPLICHRIEWSGANQVAARLAAITQLRARVQAVLSANPQRQLILVGHSHGGNIAIKVAQEFMAHKNLRLVTLATPFLIAQPRPLGQMFSMAWPLLAVLPVCLALGLVAVLLPAYWVHAAAGVVAVLAWGIYRLATSHPHIDADNQALLQTVPQLAGLDALAAQTLIVSRTGDEADGALKVAALINSWVARTVRGGSIFTQLNDWEDFMHRHASKFPPGTPPNEILADLLQPTSLLQLAPDLWRLFKMATSLTSAAQLALQIGAIAAGKFLLLLLRGAVGTGTGASATTMLVTSSETPPGEWLHVQSLPSAGDGGVLLSHSQIYSDPQVLQRVAQWLAAQYRATPGNA